MSHSSAKRNDAATLSDELLGSGGIAECNDMRNDCHPRVQNQPIKNRGQEPCPLALGAEAILLVEDVDELREAIREYLEQLGYTVLPAADGDKALEAAARNYSGIALLITDLVMPRLHGRALHKQLLLLRPGLKTIFISAYAEELSRCGASGPPAPILQKPFRLQNLGVLIREVLQSDFP